MDWQGMMDSWAPEGARYRKQHLCSRGIHTWLAWGLWQPVYRQWQTEIASEPSCPEPAPAFRDRQCLACGREEVEDHEGKRTMRENT